MTERLRGRVWQETRKRIIRRDKGLCQSCLQQGRVKAGKQVDHKIPLHKDGTNEDKNLWLLCFDCHDEKTQDERLNRSSRPKIGADGYPIDMHQNGDPSGG